MGQQQQLHIVLLPIMAQGHVIPTLDMARLFISRGVKATIITTSASSEPITNARHSGLEIGIRTIRFPPKGSSLPDHVTSMDQAMTPDMLPKFFHALALLQEPVEELLQELNANCLISDMFLPWTVDSAAKLGIPRLIFHGVGAFPLCVREQLRLDKPYNNVRSDSEPFIVPNLPHHLSFTKIEMSPSDIDGKSAVKDWMEQIWDSMDRTYGVVINSFYELEAAYADHYRNVLGRRAWHIGPLLLAVNDKNPVARGKKSAIDEHKCLAWLDSKKPNSVVYVCHGSMGTFSPVQLHDTAVGLEASGQDFIWVVRRGQNQEGNEEWLPEGFEERTKGKGLIIRGWAPQVVILNHPAVGSFVTHCGWNSTLEGICAGVPMVTWPLFAEQFFNEKLVTQILKIGVSVGNKKWQRVQSEGVPADAVAKAVKDTMVGEAAREMRSRSEYYSEMAKQAVEEGGSSYNNLNALIQELSAYTPPNKQ